MQSGVSLSRTARDLLVEIRNAAAACTIQVERIVTQSDDHSSEIIRVSEVVRGVEEATVQFEQMMERQFLAAREVQHSTDVMNEFFELVRTTSKGQRSESENLARIAADLASSSSEIAACVASQDAQGQQVREALGDLAAALAGNRTRAEELESMVESLSQQSAELDHNVSRFRI